MWGNSMAMATLGRPRRHLLGRARREAFERDLPNGSKYKKRLFLFFDLGQTFSGLEVALPELQKLSLDEIIRRELGKADAFLSALNETV